MTVLPAGIRTPARVVVLRARRNAPLDRALQPQRLLDEPRDELAVIPQPGLQPWLVADEAQGGAQQPDRGLLARREQVRRDAGDVDRFRLRAVGESRPGQAGQHVAPGPGPKLLDALGEVAVEEVERVVGPAVVFAGLAQQSAPDAGRAQQRRLV
jgi:hypothetical protein